MIVVTALRTRNSVGEVDEINRRAWDAESAAYQARHGAQLAREPAAWGVWAIPESTLALLGAVEARDILEYGCGGAQWAIALARRGARVTGLDNSSRQLDVARAAVAAAGVDVRLVHAAGESTPFGAASFDIVFCDHGAMSFAAPEQTIPEVARILRPGGHFVFSVEHPLHAVCWSHELGGTATTLRRPYFQAGHDVDPDGGTISFTRPISTYVDLLSRNSMDMERLLEPRPEPDATTSYDEFADLAWARDFPVELIIRARRR